MMADVLTGNSVFLMEVLFFSFISGGKKKIVATVDSLGRNLSQYKDKFEWEGKIESDGMAKLHDRNHGFLPTY